MDVVVNNFQNPHSVEVFRNIVVIVCPYAVFAVYYFVCPTHLQSVDGRTVVEIFVYRMANQMFCPTSYTCRPADNHRQTGRYQSVS